jgi:hypothetical protein
MFRIKFILKLLFIVNKNCIKTFVSFNLKETNMKMNNDDFEAFRKRPKFVNPKMKKILNFQLL